MEDGGMSLCDTCKYGESYGKPEQPDSGFESDIIGKRTGVMTWLFGEDVRETPVGFDLDRIKYDMDMERHLYFIRCEALPEIQKVRKHIHCSFYEKD